MRKIFAVLLSCTMTLMVFSGCSFAPQKGFVMINGNIALDNYYECLVDMNETMAVIYTASYKYTDDEVPTDENGESDSIPEITDVTSMLTLVDINKNRIIEQKEYHDKEPFNSRRIEFVDDGIVLKSYGNKSKHFDLKLNLTEETKDKDKDKNDDAIKTKFKDEAIDYCVAGLAECMQQNFNTYIFEDDADTAYIIKNEDYERPIACSGKKVITMSVYNETDKKTLNYIPKSVTFNVYDYENELKLNSYYTDFSDEQKLMYFDSISAMNDEMAIVVCQKFFSSSNEESREEAAFYLWNYSADSIGVPFETEIISPKQLKEKSDKLVEEINNKNGITVEYNVDTVPGYDDSLTEDDRYYISFEIKDMILIYDELLEIDKILDNFPKGMVARLNDFHIYLVSWITGMGAYASNRTDAFTDEASYFVVLGSSSVSDLPHELMHSFDSYILSNDSNSPLFDEYQSLNPENFDEYYTYHEHSEDEDNSYIISFVYNEDKSNIDTACFVSDYSTETPLEDKAEIFQTLYNVATNENWQDRKEMLIEAPIINKKARLICDTLREYFPEIKDTPIWEKALEK